MEAIQALQGKSIHIVFVNKERGDLQYVVTYADQVGIYGTADGEGVFIPWHAIEIIYL